MKIEITRGFKFKEYNNSSVRFVVQYAFYPTAYCNKTIIHHPKTDEQNHFLLFSSSLYKNSQKQKNLQRKYIDLVKITLHNDSTTNANTNFCSKFRMLIKMKVVREKK